MNLAWAVNAQREGKLDVASAAGAADQREAAASGEDIRAVARLEQRQCIAQAADDQRGAKERNVNWRDQRGQPAAPRATAYQDCPALGDTRVGAGNADERWLQRLEARGALGADDPAVKG